MPSYMRHSTRAVSAMLSFVPICELPSSMHTTPMPRSRPATSNELRVRVEVFSNSRTMFLPSRKRCGSPAFFIAFKRAESFTSPRICRGVRSSIFRKSQPERPMDMVGILSRFQKGTLYAYSTGNTRERR